MTFSNPPLEFQQRVYREIAEAEERVRGMTSPHHEEVDMNDDDFEGDGADSTVQRTQFNPDEVTDNGSQLRCKGNCGGYVKSHKGIAGWCAENGCRQKEIDRRKAEGSWNLVKSGPKAKQKMTKPKTSLPISKVVEFPGQPDISEVKSNGHIPAENYIILVEALREDLDRVVQVTIELKDARGAVTALEHDLDELVAEADRSYEKLKATKILT